MESSATISSAQQNLRRLTRIIGVGIALAGALLIAIIAYTGWISNASEVAAEHARVENAFNRAISRTLDLQKSIAWWDEAVINVNQKFDVDFVDINFGYFFTESYGHDEVYILDVNDKPIYSFRDGARQDPSDFYRHEPQLRAVIKGAREHSSGGLRERPDDFGANQGNYAVLRGGALEISGLEGQHPARRRSAVDRGGHHHPSQRR